MTNPTRCFPICLSAFICFCLMAPAIGQSSFLPEKTLMQRTIGAGGQDELRAITVNWRGDIAAVGNAARGDNGGQDISLAVFDAQTNPLFRRHIGRKGEDGVGNITTLPDGRYLIAGYSTKPPGQAKTRALYAGKKDGWLLVLNEKGELEKELLMGTAFDDSFISGLVAPDGNIWLVGNTQKQAWVVKLNASLDLIWERKMAHNHLATQATAATITSNGDVFLTGTVEEMDNHYWWLAGIDANGEVLVDTRYAKNQGETGVGIVALDDEKLAVTGNAFSPEERANGFFAILNTRGTVLQYKVLGGREHDQIHGLIRLSNGRILVAGGSASFERGSRRISAWVNLMDQDGNIRQEQYYGSKLDDEAFALAEHPDGRVFAVGTTARQVLKMRQGWLFQLTDRAEARSKPGLIEITLLPDFVLAPFTEAGANRGYLPFVLKNKQEKSQVNLMAMVQPVSSEHAKFFKQPGRAILVPTLSPNQVVAGGLPIQFTADCPPGQYPVNVQFYQGTLPIGEMQTIMVQVGQIPKPMLFLEVEQTEPEWILGKEGIVQITLQNKGNYPAEDVVLSSTSCKGLRAPDELVVGTLAPGEKRKHLMVFRPEYAQTGCKITVRAIDASLEHTVAAELTPVISMNQDSITAVPQQAFSVAVWMYPNPDNFDRKEIVWTHDEITIQIKIVSNKPIQRQQFCLEVNGKPCDTGTKFEEVQMKGNPLSKTFSQNIKLQEGENLLRAVLMGIDGKFEAEPLKIYYSPAKPNLHLVSIGVPSADLKYTTKDARDFANILSSPKNKAFGKVFLDTLVSEGKTTKTEMLKALRRLQYRYEDLQIQPKDLLLVFVSGHGLGQFEGGFRLAASDYDGPFMQETSLDFELEMVNYLQSLPCQKLFLVDACQSGTAHGAALSDMPARRSGLNLLVSCQADEFSYEDDAWQNGAFTHSLVKGISTYMSDPARMDTNADSRLDIQELFQYVRNEVPELVEKKKNKAKTTQHPSLFLQEKARLPVLFER